MLLDLPAAKGLPFRLASRATSPPRRGGKECAFPFDQYLLKASDEMEKPLA